MADELQCEPMICRLRFVVQDVQTAIIRRDNGIDASIIINIPDRQSPRDPGNLKDSPRILRYVYKSFSRVPYENHGFAIPQVGRSQLHRIKIVALRDQQILPAVIVIINEANPPAGMRHGYLSESRAD